MTKIHFERALLAAAVGLCLLIGGLCLPALIPAQAAPPALPADSRFDTFALTATGDDGAATGTVTMTTRLWGYIKAVHINYGASVTTTTDITISTVSPAGTVMAKSDSATDAWYYPSVQLTGSDGTGTSAYDRFPIDDYLTVQAAESTSGTVATMTVFWGQ